MKFSYKKSKGSSLISVIAVFSILLIVGIAVLSLTLSAYKSRIVESSEKKNFYFSEAGLDLAYAKINSVLQEAVTQGNAAVSAYMSDLDSIIDTERENMKNGISSKYLNSDGSIKEDYIKQKQNEFFKNGYTDLISEKQHDGYFKYVLNKVTSEEWKDGNGEYLIPIEEAFDNSQAKISSNPKVVYKISDENKETDGKVIFKNDILKLQLQSSFTEKSILKKIAVDCNILTPNYNENYYVQSKTIPIEVKSVWNKAFCVDGDLKIKGGLSVTGDAYVKGTSASDGGVLIAGDASKVTFTGDLATAGKFQVTATDSANRPDGSNVKEIKVDGNAYTANFKIGEEKPINANPSNIKVNVLGSVYTNNDLALNGSSINIDIRDGFYGINDVSKLRNSTKNYDTTRVSSSIRINSEDIGKSGGSIIKVGKEAILMGTAYINTEPDAYQTGESVSVKGNYRAYTNPLISSDYTKYEIDEDESGNLKLKKDNSGNLIKRLKPLKDESGITVKDKDGNIVYVDHYLDGDSLIDEYLNPLTLFTRFKVDNSELTYEDKRDYFRIYYDQYASNSDLDLGGEGIKLPVESANNLVHIGSIVSNGKVYLGNYVPEALGKVIDMQNKFAEMVYEMGDAKGVKDIGDVYEKGNTEKTAYNQVSFDTIRSKQIDDSKSLSTSDKIYLSGNKDYVIVGSDVDIDKLSKEDKNKYSNSTQINLDSLGRGRGIVITEGNVYLIGKINFRGTIVTCGNLETLDEKDKILNYDSEYVKQLIASNYDYFKDIFKGNTIDGPFPYEVDITSQNPENSATNKPKSKLIKTEKWKILK